MLWRLAAVLAVAVVIGMATGQLWPAIALALGGMVAVNVYALYRLEAWLRTGRRGYPPESGGVWGAIGERFYRLKKHHREREENLLNRLRQFRRATAALPDGVVAINENGQIAWFTKAAQRLLGLRRPQDVGRHITNLLRHPAFTRLMATRNFSDAVQIPGVVDDSLVLTLRVVPYGDNQQLLIARDTTHLHHLEQVRRDFVANVSHELRSPLTVISGYLEALQDSPEMSEHWHRAVDEMQEQARRMRSIVGDLLALSRLESDETVAGSHPVNIRDVLEAVEREARALSKGKHEIEFEILSDADLAGSVEDLRSAFSNLVVNAVRYTPEGGKVWVRWLPEPDGGARLEVQDTGTGIPRQDIPRLTERFYRVSEDRSRVTGGTGLGLSIVKHVLNRHEAELEIASQIGVGSTFTCRFPPGRVVQVTGLDAPVTQP